MYYIWRNGEEQDAKLKRKTEKQKMEEGRKAINGVAGDGKGDEQILQG